MSIRDLYTEQLVLAGELSSDEAETIAEMFPEKMQQVLDEVKRGAGEPQPKSGFGGAWTGLNASYSFAPVETGVSIEILRSITEKLVEIPPTFSANPKLVRLLSNRIKTFQAKEAIDWAFAESLALGSLLAKEPPFD